MTVSSTLTKTSYACDGETIVFPIPATIPYFADTDIRVILRSSAGVETVLVLNTDFEIPAAGEENEGDVVLIGDYAETPPATGTTLFIKRVLTIKQLRDFIENEAFPADDLEELHDKLIMICQQLTEILGRTVVLMETSSLSDLVLPEKDGSKIYIAWKSDGSGLEVVYGGEQGPPGVDWKGAWSDSTTYAVDDAVTHDGASYICILAHTNQEPPNATYWDILASAGVDNDAIHDDEAGEIAAITEKTTIHDNDLVLLEDSEASNAKKKAKTSNVHASALHKTTVGEIAALSEKTSLHNDDLFLIEDSEASNVKKKVKKSNVGGGGSSLRTLLFPASCFEVRVDTGWAEFAQIEGTNLDFGVLKFDKDTDEKAISPPFVMEDYDGGNITITIGWRANATSGNVMWVASFKGVADDEPWDAALSDHAFAADGAGNTAYDLMIASLTVDPAELAADEATVMKITRDADNGSDTLDADAELIFAQIEYTRSA